jgi:nitrite reductase/ring-hydroxylating ferredoxin subunit
VGAIVTGLADYFDTFGLERRFATAHYLTMATVVVIDLVSLLLRWFAGAGAHPVAVALSTIGWVILLLGAWIGGHVVYAIAYPVNRNAVVESGPDEWTAAGPAASVPAEGMTMVNVAGMNVLLARDHGVICALSDVCTHVGAPLHEGSLENGVITCPFHASKFRLRDGHTVEGPATMDLPLLQVRETDGIVEVKLTEPLHEP